MILVFHRVTAAVAARFDLRCVILDIVCVRRGFIQVAKFGVNSCGHNVCYNQLYCVLHT